MGEGEDLLGEYAWYDANAGRRLRPVGSLRPNDLGLFDLHGNAWEWCQNRYEDFPDKKDPQKEDKVDSRSSRSWRGGAFYNYALKVCSDNRYSNGPAYRDGSIGFRPARTFP